MQSNRQRIVKLQNIKLIFIASICTFVLSFVSCGSTTKVLPESFIEFEVEDYIAAEEMYEYYTYKTNHSYDKDANLDTVDITITVQHKYADEIITGKCVYYYDKGSDIWERARITQWGEPKIEFIERYLETSFSGQIGYPSGGYEITIHDIDFKNGTVDCSYYIVSTIGWNTPVEASGRSTFKINNGKSFKIPAEYDAYFSISFSENVGISVYSSEIFSKY